MPRAAYIICSASNAIDQQTNKASFFEVIETVEVFRVTSDDHSGSPQRDHRKQNGMRVIAAWMQDESDSPAEEFETDLVCYSQSGENVFTGEVVRFSFISQFHRLYTPAIPLGFPSLGVFTVECRLRKAGAAEWLLRQQYSFVVKEATPEATEDQEQVEPAI